MIQYHDPRTAQRAFPIEPRPPRREPVKTYELGRRCTDCDTVLSIYNSENQCVLHAPSRLAQLQAEEHADWCALMRQDW